MLITQQFSQDNMVRLRDAMVKLLPDGKDDAWTTARKYASGLAN